MDVPLSESPLAPAPASAEGNSAIWYPSMTWRSSVTWNTAA